VALSPSTDQDSSPPVKKGTLIAGVGLVAAGAVIAWQLWERGFVVELDQAQLQMAISAGFPVEKTYLGLLRVELSDPSVTLPERSDRLRFAVRVGVGLPGVPGLLRGTADLSGRIRYEAAPGSFYVDDPRVEGLTIKGLPDRFVEKTQGAVGWIFEGVLRGRPVYTLGPGDAPQSVAKMLLKDVRVEKGKLRLTLGVGK
jgi:hypothetical protein